MQPVMILIGAATVMFAVIGGLSMLAHYYTLSGIKSKTVGDGQHGTAQWAGKKEIREVYKHIPFDVAHWRRGENLPKEQGLVVGSTGGKGAVTDLVDTGDIHCLMIGAAGVGKTAFFLYPTSNTLTTNGNQIVIRYNPTHLVTTPGSMSMAVEVDGKPAEGGSAYRVRAKASTSKMAVTYRGGWTTLTISADGSFTYVDTKLNETLTGTLPDGAKSGVTLTLGSYTVKFNFPEDFSYFSTDIKDASGMMVSGDDMSRG